MHTDKEDTHLLTRSPDLRHRKARPRSTHIHLGRHWGPPAWRRPASQLAWWQVPVLVHRGWEKFASPPPVSLFLQKRSSFLILYSQGCPRPNASSPSSPFSRGMTIWASSNLSDGVPRRTASGTAPCYSSSCLRALVIGGLHAQGTLPRLPWLIPSSPSRFFLDVLFSIRSDPIHQSCNIGMISTITLGHLSRSRYNSRWFVFIYSAQWPWEVDTISDLQMKQNA